MGAQSLGVLTLVMGFFGTCGAVTTWPLDPWPRVLLLWIWFGVAWLTWLVCRATGVL